MERSFDPDDYIRDDSQRDRERREQIMIDQMRMAQEREERRRRERMADVVNDMGITVDKEMMNAINDPEIVMTPAGDLARITRRSSSSSSPFANQFRIDKILPRSPAKKKRKKNPRLAKAFKEANAKLRLKNGKLRKGKTQGDVARLAHRLMKKM